MKHSFILFQGIFILALISCISAGVKGKAEGEACGFLDSDCQFANGSCSGGICFKKCKTSDDCTGTNNACDTGSYTKVCRPGCKVSADCGKDFFCTANSNVCKAKGKNSCAIDSDCLQNPPTVVQVCSAQGKDSGACYQTCKVSTDCTVDPNFPTCNDTRCISGCIQDSDCKLGYNGNEDNKNKTICVKKDDGPVGSCKQACKTSQDCFPGQEVKLTRTVCAKNGFCESPNKDCGTDADCKDGKSCVQIYNPKDITGACRRRCKTSADCPPTNNGATCGPNGAQQQVCLDGCYEDKECAGDCVVTNATCTGGCLKTDGDCPAGGILMPKICDTSRAKIGSTGDCRLSCTTPNTTDTCPQKSLSEDGNTLNNGSYQLMYCTTKEVAKAVPLAELPTMEKMSITICTRGTPPTPAPAAEEGSKKKKKPKPGKGRGKKNGQFPSILQRMLQALQQVKSYFSSGSG